MRMICWNKKGTFQNRLRIGNFMSFRSGPLAHSLCTPSMACHACLASVCLVRVLGQHDQKCVDTGLHPVAGWLWT